MFCRELMKRAPISPYCFYLNPKITLVREKFLIAQGGGQKERRNALDGGLSGR
jgi:hypothetical protein